MHFYITYNDAPSGIYSSQVIDVVKFYNIDLKIKMKLISFISIRGFLKNKKLIKQQLPSAIVLPMYPKLKNWKNNLFLLNILCIIYKPNTIIGRSVFATKLALLVKHKCKAVVYDGRGAIAAEWKEYNVVTDKTLVAQIAAFEKEVILESDFRIAVSNALVNFWNSEYDYTSTKHVVIPCTINAVFQTSDDHNSTNIRNEFNFKTDDVVFVYSGSLAGWQSFGLLVKFLSPLLKLNLNYKVLFLSQLDENIKELQKTFPDQIACKYLQPTQVVTYLLACNYGLLLREETITNKVASPVKFAEYLACGLPVIISNNLGDYSNFAKQHNCGYIPNQNPLSKKEIQNLALLSFTKTAFINSYLKIVSVNAH